MRIAQDVGGARDHFHFDFLHVVGLDVVFLDRLHHGGERRVTERFDRETLHPAIKNAVVRLRGIRKVRNQRFTIERGRFALVLHMMEHGKESFLAIDDVLGTGKSVAREKRALRAHASRPRIDRVLHVGQLARRDRAGTKCARRADADGRNHLLRREIQHATGRDRRRERAQCRMMPAVFAHARPADFAKPHLDFVGDDGGENQILAAESFAFAECQRRSDEIAWMTRVGLPIDVVVIHRADHVAVQKRRIHRIGLEAGNKRGGSAIAAGHRAIMLEQNLGVILLAAAQRAADGIEPE